MPHIHVKALTNAISVRQEGERVLLLDARTGRLIANMPWKAAEDLAYAILRQAGKAEVYTWMLVDKEFTDPPLRRILGMPVIESRNQLEKL